MLFDCAQLALFAAAILTAGRSAVQRTCAIFFVACAVILAWYAPGVPFARGLRAFLAGGSLMLAITIAFSSEKGMPLRSRLSRILSLPGPMRATRVPATWSLRVAGQIILDLIIAGIALLILLRARYLFGMTPLIERLAAGVVVAYSGVQFVFDLARFCFLATGWSVDSLHRTPIAARSLAEFWGQRWNRYVSAWLHRFVFLPLARRRHPRLGIFCAFLVSGLLHGWPILAAIGWLGALTTSLFFVAQGAFVLVEHRLRVHSWPVPIARAWTVSVLLATLPLFIDPGLKVFGL